MEVSPSRSTAPLLLRSSASSLEALTLEVTQASASARYVFAGAFWIEVPISFELALTLLMLEITRASAKRKLLNG